MENIFALQFFQNALYASILSAIVCGVIGTYIVIRRIVFVSGGITHASFGGLGIGMYLGINPLVTAAITAVLSALGISQMSRYGKIREDSAIASIWALGMAIGVLFMSLTPGYTSGLSSYLFGNILLVSQSDLWFLAALAIIIALTFCLGYKPILYTTFDTDFAKTKGIKTELIHTGLLILVAITMVLCIRIVGIMLLLSLLTLPQSIVSLFSSKLKTIIFGSIGISLLANLSGLIISTFVFTQIPTGVIIVLLLFALFFLAELYRNYMS